MIGRYIVFEGPDLVGKTTVAEMTRSWLLDEHGIDSVYAQQPGSTSLGQQLRHIIKHERRMAIGLETEAMVFVLDQMAFVENIALGALDGGKWIISDRNNNISALVYQALKGVKPSRIDEFYATVPSPQADVAFLLYANPKVLTLRAKNRGDEQWDRYESNKDFMASVYAAYDSILGDHGERIRRIAKDHVRLDAAEPIEQVFSKVKSYLSKLL